MDARKALDLGESFMMTSDWDLAEKHLLIALDKAKGDRLTVAHANACLSVIYYNTGKFIEGLDAILKVAAMLDEKCCASASYKNDPWIMIYTSFVYHYKSDFQKPFEIAKGTLNSFKKSGDMGGVVMSYYIIACAYFHWENFSLAYNYFEKAYNMIDDKEGRKACVMRFMMVHSLMAMRNFEKAQVVLELCEASVRKSGFKSDLGRLFVFKSIYAFQTKDFKSGNIFLSKAEDVVEKAGYAKGIIDLDFARGIREMNEKNLRQAAHFLSRADKEYESIGDSLYHRRTSAFLKRLRSMAPEMFL